VDDGCLAYDFLLKNAERWGIIPEKIAVGGDSAGGALAAAVSIFAQEKGLQTPCAQMLIYPACGPFFQSEEYSSAPMCSEKDLKKFMRLYLKKGERESVYIAPILGVNADTPPSFIETAEVDYLRVCGEKYAEKLQEFGVEFILRETKGTIHAYDMVLESSITKKSIEKRVEFLRYIFGKDRGKD
jgi:acetyl esterase/lipase